MAVTKGLGGRTGRSPVTVAVVYPCGHSLGGGSSCGQYKGPQRRTKNRPGGPRAGTDSKYLINLRGFTVPSSISLSIDTETRPNGLQSAQWPYEHT